MDKKLQHSLEKEIANCKQKLAELEPQIARNPNLARVYNKILIKKAILSKKYKKVRTKPSIKEKIKRLLSFHRKEKLICDYFHSEA